MNPLEKVSFATFYPLQKYLRGTCFSKNDFLSCQTRIFSGEPFFKWTQPSNKQFKAASKHVDEIRTIYDCGKIKMNPNDRLLLVSLNKSFDDAKANGVYQCL